MRKLLVGLLLIIILCVGGLGAKLDKSMKILYSYQNVQQPVEQQTPGGCLQPDRDLWIVNNTGCLWDADDKYKFIAMGELQPGESFEVPKCFVADWSAHLLGMKAWIGPRDSAEACIIMSDGHSICGNFEYYKNKGDRGYSTRMCMSTPDYNHSNSQLLPIEDSNGGVGVPMTVTWTIRNTGSRVIKDASIMGRFSLNANYNHDDYCPCEFPLSSYGECEGYYPRVCWIN